MLLTSNKKRITMLMAFLLAMAAEAQPLADEKTADPKSFTFGIVPQQSASKMARLWSPILQNVSERSGYHLQFKTAPSIPVFEQRLSAGEYDFAYMNPYHFTVYHDSVGYEALVKAKDKQIKGIMVVRNDSTVNALTELQGQTLAFPSLAAFAASILPRSELQKRAIEFEPRYVSSHDSVYLNVASGRMLAGGGVLRTFNNMTPEVREHLRILWTTPGYTPHALAAHPRVPMAIRQAVAEVLMQMAQNEAGRSLLQSIKITGWEGAQNSDWDDVRALNIQLLQ